MYDLPDYHFDGEARGWELLNNLTVKYEVPLTQNVMIGLNNEFYYKHSWYRNYPDMNAFDYTAGMYARIKLKDTR